MAKNILFVKFIIIIYFGIILSGCIKSEAPNMEADILGVEVDGVELLRDPQITNTTVILPVLNAWSDVRAITPRFTLTEGATITPKSGVVQDFTNPVKYTVTSEDGAWKKEYIITAVLPKSSSEFYSFEYAKEFSSDVHYHIFMDSDGEKASQEWESSNLGYAFIAGNAPATVYPVQQYEDGFKGSCAKLTTKSTGSFGAMFGMPLATGSLYLGELDTSNILVEPLKGTRFGIPTDKVPLAVTGHYKYSSGENFIGEGAKVIEGRRDIFDIYAVFYEVTEDLKMLDGTNIFTHPNIVSIGRISNPKETDQWTPFGFEMTMMEGKKIDPEKLAMRGYNFTIVFSSSKDGAIFQGADGSVLLVDEIRVFFE